MRKFSKLLGIFVIAIIAILMVSCKDPEPDPDPDPDPDPVGVLTWSGLDDVTIASGDRVDVLDGVSVSDTIDGNLSSSIFVLNEDDHEDILVANGWWDDFVEFNNHVAGNYKVYYGVDNSTDVTEYKAKNFFVRDLHNVPNGDFSMKNYLWGFDIPGGSGSVSYEDGKANVTITGSGTEWWAIQLMQTVKFKADETYKITFVASSEQNYAISLGFEDMSNNYAMMDSGVNVHVLSNEMKEYTYYYTATQDYNNVKAVFYLGNQNPNNSVAKVTSPAVVSIDSVYIEKVKLNTEIVFAGNTNTLTLPSGSFSLSGAEGKTDIDIASYVTASKGETDVTDQIRINGTVAETVLGNTGFLVQYVIELEDGSVAFAKKRFSVNLVKSEEYNPVNSEFDSGIAGWTLDINQTNGTGAATIESSGSGTVLVTMTKASSANWHMQLFQNNLVFRAGNVYVVTIRVKGTDTGTNNAAMETVDVNNNYANIKNTSFRVTEEWQEIRMIVEPTKNYNNVRVGFQFGRLNPTSVLEIDYIHVELLDNYDVTFDLGYEGSAAPTKVSVAHGYKVAEPDPAPTREGFDFLGWHLDNVLYSFDSEVTKAITLVAKWEAKGDVDNEAPTLEDVAFTKGVAKYTLVISAEDNVGLKNLVLSSSLVGLLPSNELLADANPFASTELADAYTAEGITVTYNQRVWTLVFEGDSADAISGVENISFYFIIEDLAGNKFGTETPNVDNTKTFAVVPIEYYEVQFNEEQPLTYIEGTVLTKPENPTPEEGFKFFRWEIADETGVSTGVEYIFSNPLESNLHLLAIFTTTVGNTLFNNPTAGMYISGDAVYQTGTGDQKVYFNTTGSYYIAKTTVLLQGRLGADNYPKVGMLVGEAGNNELFFFFDPRVSKDYRAVLSSARLNGAWTWGYKTGERLVGGLDFNQELELTVVRNGNDIWLFVDDIMVSRYTTTDLTGDSKAGLFTINYAAKYTNSSIVADQTEVNNYLSAYPAAINAFGWVGDGYFTVTSASDILVNNVDYIVANGAQIRRTDVLTGDFYIEYDVANIDYARTGYPKISLLLHRYDGTNDTGTDNISIGANFNSQKRMETNFSGWKNWSKFAAAIRWDTGFTIRIERTIVDGNQQIKILINDVVQTVDSLEFLSHSYVGDYRMGISYEGGQGHITNFAFGAIV